MASDYRSPHVTQIDSGKCRRTNCWAAVGAYLVRSATRGRKRPTPMQFRKAAGALKDCRTGGLGDIVVGCAKYGVNAKLLLDVPRDKASAKFSSNKSTKVYAVPFDWEVWPLIDKCAGDYDGYHMAALVPGLNKKTEIRTMDPLCNRHRWVKRKRIMNSAIEYNNEHFGQKKNTIDMVVVNVPKR